MSAILAAALATCKAGDEIVSMQDVYGGTIKLFGDVLSDLGIVAKWMKFSDVGNLSKFCSKKTKLIFIETPTNPTLRCVDLAAAVRDVKSSGALLMVDNTFATPVLQRPLEFGCDIVMHSATKYLGGHSDISAGAVVARDPQLVAKMRDMSVATGGTLDPEAAYLLIRGLKTLELRVERASKNAEAVAEYLHRHKKVSRVMYPGLPESEGHEIARKQMSGFGMMLSANIRGGGKAAERFIDSLKLWYLATSLGGVESTVSYPVLSSHVNCSPKQLKELEISDETVRLSVGIESADDLIADLEQALGKA
jgi:cystathionine beta-lyase